MKTVHKSARVETAFGSPLAEPITFSYTYEEVEKGDEIPAKEQLDADDIRQFVNQKRNSAARASEQTKVFSAKGIEKPELKDNPAEQLKQMVKVLVAAGYTQENAEKTAKSALNIEL